jgi:hypothetical protein
MLVDEIRDLDKLEYVNVISRLLSRHRYNRVIENALVELIRCCRRCGVKVAYFKGLSLAKDLYEKNEVRQIGDIDILVDIENLETVLDLVGELGYVLSENGELVCADMASYVYKAPFVSHVGKFIKYVDIDGVKWSVVLEVHINLFLRPWRYSMTDTRNIMDRAILKNICGEDIWQLEMYDILVFLLYHFTMHYVDDFGRASCELGRDRSANSISKLYDITLFVDKYHASIDWTVFLSRVEELVVWNEVAFATRIFNRIFPNRFPEGVLHILEDGVGDKGDVYARRISPRALPLLMKMNEDDLILSRNEDFYELASKLVSILRTSDRKLACPYGKPYYQHKETFRIDEHDNHISNRLGTYLHFGDKPKSSVDFSASGGLWWDKLYFYIRIRMFDKKWANEKGRGNYVEPDKIELLIDNGKRDNYKPFITKLLLSISINQEDFAVILRNEFQESPQDSNYRLFSWTIYDDGYEFVTGISWDYIGIEPRIGMVLGFDIAVRDYNIPKSLVVRDVSSRHCLRTRLAWSNSGSSVRDSTMLGAIVLTEK